MAPPCDLGGKGVLVTRPAGQAAGLCRCVAEAGGRAICFPTIAIQPTQDPAKARHLLAESWDLMIFISQNAVECAVPLLPGGRLPAASRLAAIGRSTAQALTGAGRAPDLLPGQRFDSESLLTLPELADLTGQRVLIVRGEGGRPLLGDTLVQRGAELAYAEVYRRALPEGDAAQLVSRWRREVHLVTVTSDEILLNLCELVGERGRELLIATPLVVVSERTAQTAALLGFTHVEVADNPADEAIVAALCRIN
jgi:uroporphyrinogen-III synthase